MDTVQILGADFETDTINGRKEVVQWAISNGKGDIEKITKGRPVFAWTGKDRLSFRGKLFELAVEHGGHTIVYFHNFSGYDSYYLMDLIHDLQGDRPFQIVDDSGPIMLTYEWIVDDKKIKLEFRDSMRQINKPLRDIGKMLGVAKLVPPDSEFKVGWSDSIDYSNMRYDQQDWKYVSMDAWICARAMIELWDKGFTAATISGQAWRMCRQTFDKKFKSKDYFSKKFPTHPVITPEMEIEGYDWDEVVGDFLVDDATIRKAYWGGINATQHQGLHIATPQRRIWHVDYHSMYPSQMLYRPLPYGKCFKVERPRGTRIPKRYEGEIYFAEVRLTRMSIKPGRIPWYQLKDPRARSENGIKQGDAVSELIVPTTIVACDIELQDIIDTYDVEFTDHMNEDDWDHEEEDSGFQVWEYWRPTFYYYYTAIGLLADYIMWCYEWKASEEAADRKNGLWYEYSKLLMNSVYGRMSMNPLRKNRILVEAPEIKWYKWATDGEGMQMLEGFDGYIPYGAAVCAWARHQVLEGWKAVGYENVLHTDTDSIIFISDRIPDALRMTGNIEGTEGSKLDTWGNERPVKYKKGENKYEVPDTTVIAAILECNKKRYIEFAHWPPTCYDDFIGFASAGIPRPVKTSDNGETYVAGMGVELYDDPMRFLVKGDERRVLGDPHYVIRSGWLREMYIRADKDPDDVNTMKKMRMQCEGGVDLVDKNYDLADTGLRMRLGR